MKKERKFQITQKTIDRYSEQLIFLWNQFKTDKEISTELGLAITPTYNLRRYLNLPAQSLRHDFLTCKVCNIRQPRENFNWNVKANNDIDRTCKECHKEKMKNKRIIWKNRNFTVDRTPPEYIYCPGCDLNKSPCEFYKNSNSPSGYSTYCTSCAFIKRGASLKDYFLRRKRNGVTQTGREFSITEQDLFLPETCPILNVPLVYRGSKENDTNKHKHLASVDRIDNSKGYVPGNILVISKFANTMKNSGSLSELKIYCENMLKLINYYEQNGSVTNPQDIFPDLKLLE